MRIFFAILICLFLTACTQPATHKVASSHGFESVYVKTSTFNLATYQKIRQPGAPINVYIEGDGNAWRSRNSLSPDPSPRSSTVIKLATLDTCPNVVYIARPCQFSPEDLKTVCNPKHWSVARYSNEVIKALDNAITQIKAKAKTKQINLIGYSGGGSLAVLVASMRQDITSIRTIAGNLDLQAMEKYHKTTPLSESIDPISVAKKISHIPQIHFSGAKDKIVPSKIAYNFVKASELDKNAVVIIADANHAKGWDKHWPELLKHKPNVQ